jgi:PAS domain S-box-containing protein
MPTVTARVSKLCLYLLRLVGVFLLYLVAGKLGLAVPFTSGNVSPVWPAAGVGLAAVLLWGYSVWPGIAAAAFFVNFLSPIPPAAAAGIAVGNTSSALVAGYLLRRFGRVELSLARLRDVLSLLILGAIVSTTVAASVGTTTLFLTHVRPWSAFGTAWRVWWIGDAMGVLVVAPLLLVGRGLGRSLGWTRGSELLTLLLAATATGFAIFSRVMGLSLRDDVLAYALFPFVIWAALRFHVMGAAAVSFLVSAIAVWGTAQGYGPFVKSSPLHNSLLLQSFLALVSVTGLILAAVIREREHISEAFETKEKLLAELERKERSLQENQARLDLAQQAARIGVWEWDLESDEVLWCSGAPALYGIKQSVYRLRYQEWLQMVHPDDRDPVRRSVDNALAGTGEHDLEFRTIPPDGALRWLAGRGKVFRDPTGKPVRMIGICVDVTELKRAQDGLREAHDQLEERVAERTAELAESNRALLAEISDRTQAQDALRVLSGRLLHLQDEERRRIARELHDSTGQSLAALQMNLAVVLQRTSSKDGKITQALADSVELAQQVVNEIRTMSYLLHPPLLDEAGLASALRWYVDGVRERSKIKIDLDLSPQIGRLSQGLETAIFRIVQECLANIHRHSGSSSAKIRLAHEGSLIRLTVQDEGKGISPEFLQGSGTQMPSTAGVGIRGMQERVRDLGGLMRIRPANPGTIVEVELPLARRDALRPQGNVPAA